MTLKNAKQLPKLQVVHEEKTKIVNMFHIFTQHKKYFSTTTSLRISSVQHPWIDCDKLAESSEGLVKDMQYLPVLH
ncbi:Hypothetical predicted protein [Octopus vulgaris]|uniref:Uncharacterized protein n=1 Tax=Octopus vulgaris TaxID=6645 RepID=A0AA36AN57_OCTVU|nr:Hypothetical predicted protein [Octopus vulgaris]